MIILNNEIENLPELVYLLSHMGHVVQVRGNEVLKQSFKDQMGGECLNITCMVQKRDGSDDYIPFKFIFSVKDINDIEKHDTIIQKIKLAIDDYVYKDIPPKGIEGVEL